MNDEWSVDDWRKFAALALHAAGTAVAKKRGWDEMLLCAARDAIDIAIEISPKTA